MSTTLTITQPQLAAALLRWEQQARAGETRAFEETRALPAEQVAEEGAQALWNDLKQATGSEGSP